MLVGDVRCATLGTGSSWKLSGGSQLSSGPTKVSKYAHVRRARPRRKTSWLGFRRGSRRASGLLSHHVMPGDNNHSRRTGAAHTSAAGLEPASPARVAVATAGATHIDRNDASSDGARLCDGAPNGLHARRRRWETSMRHVVRSTASVLTNASCGRQTSASSAWVNRTTAERSVMAMCSRNTLSEGL